MSFPIVTNSGTSTAVQIGTGLLYSNVVYFPISPIYTVASRTVAWIVPPGVTTVRVRVWGGGGGSGSGGGGGDSGGGGGFSLRTITGLTPGASITVTIGLGGPQGTTGQGGTSSFGAYASATGGRNNSSGGGTGGVGSSGDINMNGSGARDGGSYGGNAGNIFIAFTGTSADGPESSQTSLPILTLMGTPTNPLDKIGTGYLFGVPSTAFVATTQTSIPSTTPAPPFNYFGNGTGGQPSSPFGGYPGGGGGSNNSRGGAGLVIVEY